MKGFKPLPFLALSLCLGMLTACGSGHPANGPGALNIANKPPDGVVQSPYTVQMAVTGGQGPFAWQLTSGTLPPGLGLTPQGVISGTPPVTDLNADGTAKAYTFMLKVTDSQIPTSAYQTGSFTITINPLPVVTTTSLPNGTIGLPYNATLTNSGGLSPFTWSITTGTLPAGLTLAASTGIIGGTPTGPSGAFPITVQVTDADSNTATAPLVITIVGRLQGTFAFSFNGFDQGQPFYTAGSFLGDGTGTITSGVLDQNGLAAGDILSDAPLTGTYNIGTNGQGTMTLTFGGTTYNYDLAPALKGDLKFILNDSTHPQIYGSGVIKAQALAKLGQTQQSGLMALAGNFGLGFFGVDPAGQRSVGAGAFKADNSGSFSNGIEDTNDNGVVTNAAAFTGSWTLDADFATTGRGTATLNVGANVLDYVFYVVDPASEVIEVQSDAVSGGASLSLVSVAKQLQGSVNGTFSNGSLNSSAVMELNGATSAGPDVQLGVGQFDGRGNITLFQTDENKAGTHTVNTFTGTYNIPTGSTNGRVTVAGLGGGAQPIFYLTNANRGFYIGADASATEGTFEPQLNAPFSLPSFLIAYAGGTIQPVSSSVTNEVDFTTIPAPGGTMIATYDTSGPAGQLTNQMLSSTYALGDDPGGTGQNTTGKIILTAVGSPSPTAIVYMINGPPAAAQDGTIDRSNNRWASINIATPTGVADPNPRLTVVASTTK
jgi:Putative Ig domain